MARTHIAPKPVPADSPGASEMPEREALAPVQSIAGAASDENAVDESLYLTGRPKLRHFLRFVRHHAIDPDDEGTLSEEWHAAKRHIEALEKLDAGRADDPPIHPIELDRTYEPLLAEFLKDPLVRNGFNAVPTEVAFVELDRLVVYQKHIDLTFVRQLRKRLGTMPSDEEVFRACLPFDHVQPPSRWSRLDDDSYVFVSPSNDMRFLGAMSLKPNHVRGHPHPGALVGVVGLAVGFGSNFLNAIRAGNRLILNNGSHRAYALRDLGLKRVPCVVQHASTRDELDVVASADVRNDPALFLEHPRPPMLVDYFDPKLRKVMQVKRVLRQVKVRFSVSEYSVPAL